MDESVVEVELHALREDVRRLRAEQQELAQAIAAMSRTFQMIATHLGIASGPYGKSDRTSKDRELPGFA